MRTLCIWLALAATTFGGDWYAGQTTTPGTVELLDPLFRDVDLDVIAELEGDTLTFHRFQLTYAGMYDTPRNAGEWRTFLATDYTGAVLVNDPLTLAGDFFSTAQVQLISPRGQHNECFLTTTGMFTADSLGTQFIGEDLQLLFANGLSEARHDSSPPLPWVKAMSAPIASITLAPIADPGTIEPPSYTCLVPEPAPVWIIAPAFGVFFFITWHLWKEDEA